MTHYLLIESRDPIQSRDFSRRCDLALALLAERAQVTMFLLENAVLGARAAANLRELEKLAKAGVRLFADEFALRERGIDHEYLTPAVRPAKLDALISRFAVGAKAIWS